MMDAVAKLLREHRFHFANEVELHNGIELVLTDAGHSVQREVRLTAHERIDFIIDGRLGIEVKIKGSTTDLMRQAIRYAGRPELDGLLVVTTLARHRLPDTLNGKPVVTVYLEVGAF